MRLSRSPRAEPTRIMRPRPSCLTQFSRGQWKNSGGSPPNSWSTGDITSSASWADSSPDHCTNRINLHFASEFKRLAPLICTFSRDDFENARRPGERASSSLPSQLKKEIVDLGRWFVYIVGRKP